MQRSACVGTGSVVSSQCTPTSCVPSLTSSWPSVSSPPGSSRSRVVSVSPAACATTSTAVAPSSGPSSVAAMVDQSTTRGVPSRSRSRPGRPTQPSVSCGSRLGCHAASSVAGGVWRPTASASAARSASFTSPRSAPQCSTAGRPGTVRSRSTATPSRRSRIRSAGRAGREVMRGPFGGSVQVRDEAQTRAGRTSPALSRAAGRPSGERRTTSAPPTAAAAPTSVDSRTRTGRSSRARAPRSTARCARST